MRKSPSVGDKEFPRNLMLSSKGKYNERGEVVININRKILVLTFAYALFIVAASLSFTPQGYLQLPSETPEARIFNNVGFVSGYLIIALITLRKDLRVMPLAVPLLAGAAVIVSQAVFSFQNSAGWSLPLWTPAFLHGLTGLSFALLFTFWASTAYLVDVRRFRFIILAGSLISTFIVVFASAPESFLVVPVVKIGAMASSLLLLLFFHYRLERAFVPASLPSPAMPHPSGIARSAIRRLRNMQGLFAPIAATGILGFVYQYAWTFVGVNNLASLSFAIGEAFAVALIFLLASIPNGHSFSISRVFRVLCPIACVAIVPLFFTGGIVQLLFMGIDSAVFNLFIILLMPLCASIGKRKGIPVAWLYALSGSVVNLFPALGFAVGSAPATRESAVLFAVALVALAALFAAALYADRDNPDMSIALDGSRAGSSDGNDSEDIAARPNRSQIALRLSEEYGLTKREGEILEFLLLGRNAPAIAEELVISTNTVKTHIKRMYQKMGIHSRQELADLTEELEAF